MSIRIAVDSGADLEYMDYCRYGIELVPLSLTIDQRIFPATEKFNKVDFFRLLEASEVFPKTSQPAPSTFETLFEDARQKGDELIFISLAAVLSGTNQTANVVKGMGGYDNVYIIDGKSATVALKILALHAVKLRKEGKSAAQIVAEVEALRNRIQLIAGLDTLEYLRRGGRLSSAAASIGSLARIKPVVQLGTEGNVVIAGKCIGKARAMKDLVSILAQDTVDPDFPVYGVYAGTDENLNTLLPKISSLGIDIFPENRFCIGPVIGAHIGPGAYGIVYVSKTKE